MKVVGDYHANGYAHVEQLISPEVARAFVAKLKDDLGDGALPVSSIEEFPNLLSRPAFEIYGHFYPPMLFFLWGLTPIMTQIVAWSQSPITPTTIQQVTIPSHFSAAVIIPRKVPIWQSERLSRERYGPRPGECL